LWNTRVAGAEKHTSDGAGVAAKLRCALGAMEGTAKPMALLLYGSGLWILVFHKRVRLPRTVTCLRLQNRRKPYALSG
jgi:hypothetical protein